MTQTPPTASGEERRRAEAPRPPTRPPVLQSATLLQGENEVLIQHGTETYRLRVTKAGKLILQK
jgi:hemin uptake protein HemP